MIIPNEVGLGLVAETRVYLEVAKQSAERFPSVDAVQELPPRVSR